MQFYILQRLKFPRQLFVAIIIVPAILTVCFLAYASIDATVNTLWIPAALLALLLTILFAIFYVQKLTSRIMQIKTGVANLADGKLEPLPVLKGADEITSIADNLNMLVQNLGQVNAFAKQIGAGDLNASYQSNSASDLLGNSLLRMKDDLIAMKTEEQKRNWATEGLANFADVLQSNRDVKSLSDDIIKNLVKSLNANQGSIYILNDERTNDTFLELKACYAYSRSKHISQRIEIGSGILGQAFLERETVLLKEIPQDFVRITSGLGDATPNCILIVPLKTNKDIVGMVEVASFNEFEPHQVAFVEKLSENIAFAITSFRINENTTKMLAESRLQAERLRAQEEELRQNQEELQATQEEISRKYDRLFHQLTELNYQSKFDQLTSINSTKKRSIEYYFDIIRNQIITFSENKTVVEAVKAFRKAFYQLDASSSEIANMKASLQGYYNSEFLTKLNDNATIIKTVDDYLPEDVRPLVLQYQYISANPYPTGEKQKLDAASDGSSYSKSHKEYHPVIRNFLEKFGYYDIFLIDHVTGDMLYSVFKEVDFATSLLTGCYHSTNFGRVVKEAIESTDRHFVKLIDFEPYDPSYRAPASFIACPIYEQDEKIGILVFQMPINKINQVLTGDNKWEEDGLGKTGETFMIGNDFKLRSISRRLIQHRESYLAGLAISGYTNAVINEIIKTNTSILLEEVKNDSARKALNRQSGTQMDSGANGGFLCAYTPLQIQDVSWVLMSTLSETEASQKLNSLRQM